MPNPSEGARMFFKVLTHDYRPPVQGGEPVWDGETLPFELPAVTLDTSGQDCGAGWNFTDSLPTALKITKLWPYGRPVACFTVEPSADAIVRGDKHRCSQLTLTGRVATDEVRAAIRELSAGWFADEHVERMTDSQHAWFTALGRPQAVNEQRIDDALKEALAARGLTWELARYDSAWDAWDARDARGARGAWDAWDAWGARDARGARDAWDAWDARGAWDAWDAWDARGAWEAWDARGARDAWDALTVEYASLMGWVDKDPLKLTTGLREAYEFGLEIAIPTAPNVLGWSSKP